MKESFYSWNEYSFLFKRKAQEFKVSEDTILGLLTYSKKLVDRKLPIIYDIKHLSFLTSYRESYIRRVMVRPANFYRTFKIPKKNGESREITEPLPGLKEIQYWILSNIINVIAPNELNNAYAKGKSIKSNAKYHTKQPIVLNLDIEKYFDNIGLQKVADFFNEIGYSTEVSHCLATLCTLNNGLPQGSPSSPRLSSLITRAIDTELLSYCRNQGLRYSRYADDITISGDFKPGLIIPKVEKVLKSYGFTTNKKKTRTKLQHQRQIVTGVVVNRQMSVRKSELREMRKTMYFINKFGLESHSKKINLNKSGYVHYLLGKINFFLFIKKGNRELTDYKKHLIELLEKQF